MRVCAEDEEDADVARFARRRAVDEGEVQRAFGVEVMRHADGDPARLARQCEVGHRPGFGAARRAERALGPVGQRAGKVRDLDGRRFGQARDVSAVEAVGEDQRIGFDAREGIGQPTVPHDGAGERRGRVEIVRQRAAQVGVVPRLDPAMRQAFGGEAGFRLAPPRRDGRGCAHAAARTISS